MHAHIHVSVCEVVGTGAVGTSKPRCVSLSVGLTLLVGAVLRCIVEVKLDYVQSASSSDRIRIIS